MFSITIRIDNAPTQILSIATGVSTATNTVATTIFPGNVQVFQTTNIINFPVIISTFIQQNTIIQGDGGINIVINNAPTTIFTTATGTSTVTATVTSTVTTSNSVPTAFILSPAPAVAQARRQLSILRYISPTGNISTSCSEAQVFTIANGQLLSGGSLVSVNRGVASAPFVAAQAINDISTTFSISDTLQWSNPAFSGGKARFCSGGGRLNMLFTLNATLIDCTEQNLFVIPASACVNGDIVSSTSTSSTSTSTSLGVSSSSTSIPVTSSSLSESESSSTSPSSSSGSSTDVSTTPTLSSTSDSSSTSTSTTGSSTSTSTPVIETCANYTASCSSVINGLLESNSLANPQLVDFRIQSAILGVRTPSAFLAALGPDPCQNYTDPEENKYCVDLFANSQFVSQLTDLTTGVLAAVQTCASDFALGAPEEQIIFNEPTCGGGNNVRRHQKRSFGIAENHDLTGSMLEAIDYYRSIAPAPLLGPLKSPALQLVRKQTNNCAATGTCFSRCPDCRDAQTVCGPRATVITAGVCTALTGVVGTAVTAVGAGICATACGPAAPICAGFCVGLATTAASTAIGTACALDYLDICDPINQRCSNCKNQNPGICDENTNVEDVTDALDVDVGLGFTVGTGAVLFPVVRSYWPGLESLQHDGSNTLMLRGGFDLVKDTCASTAVKFITAVDLPRTGFHLAHMQEVKMFKYFARSLMSGIAPDGGKMRQTFAPMVIYNNWHMEYPVSLPRIGSIVTDTNGAFTEPLTFNDRMYETIGSYAYRSGISFVPRAINSMKYMLLSRKYPKSRSVGPWNTLINRVANNGDKEALQELLGNVQLVISTFNYLNDAQLAVGFAAAGRTLAKEMVYASEFIPGFKGIDLAWAQFEPAFYNAAVTHTLGWLESRSGLILQKFASGGAALTNPAVMKLVYETTLLAKQKNRIVSLVAS
ncbi:hypothetical protein VTL71DRAFT_16581 [Oculimacula yallundae]|uniref:DUF7908 domain-containing protein n=1 Tax=Oculimacula yallundae TaxID=86028 RepID=A0ABR4CH30_9HELO